MPASPSRASDAWRWSARACSGKYGGALTTTIEEIVAGDIVAMCSRTIPPPLTPIVLTLALAAGCACIPRTSRPDVRLARGMIAG
ncbi:MAG TPA: hypothetical protein VIL35_10715 [Vicinamibacterales bacterium]